MNSETKNCQNCKNTFVIEPDDFSFYEKIKVPPPTFCPECRLIRRLRSRNERVLFKTSCNLCNKNILTIFHPENNFIIYCSDCYASDKWNPLEYGVQYDFSKPFFVQLSDLQKKVPHKALHEVLSQDCEYANYVLSSKNIYLSFTTCDSEFIFYTRSADRCKECIDCYNILDCEGCYGCIQTSKSYRSTYLLESRNCVDCHFLYDAVNCTDCFMSSNIRNKQYFFGNKQLTRDEYIIEIEKIKLFSNPDIKKLKAEFHELVKSGIHRFAITTNSVDVSGDNIVRSKNVKDSFHVTETENCRFVMRTIGLRDSYDVWGSLEGELLYEVHGGARGSRNSHFMSIGNVSIDCEYTDFCTNAENVFGCVSLNNYKYCIFNTQYSKEDYFKLKDLIIAHMKEMPYIDERGVSYSYGEYFPQICMAFAYNESAAQEFFPLSKEEIIKKGYLYREDVSREYVATILSSQVPLVISEVSDSIINEVIQCEHCDICVDHRCVGVFKITADELSFYKKYKIQLPLLCPNCRHYERLEYIHMPKLYERSCSFGVCANTFKTTFAPNQGPEKIYCESCYQNEVL